MEQQGGFNYCNLPPNAKIYFGSGGSDGIITVLDDRAYKYFPFFATPYMNNQEIKKQLNYNKYEISVIKELTKSFIKTNKTPHLIEYYGSGICNKIPTNIFSMCKSYDEYLMDKKKAEKQCKLIVEKGYPRKLISPMYVLEMEKANNSLENQIESISKKKWDKIESFLDRLYFQVFFTLETIKLVYPNYKHNDLFIRNILTNNIENENEKYIRYHYNNMVFDMPANGLFIKINDFGMNQLSKEFNKKNKINDPLIIDPYRDYFSIIYDVYNGGNLGGKSLKSLIKNKKKLKQIDKYFNQFIDIKNINKIIKNNKKKHLDWDWGKMGNSKLIKLFGLKKFDYYIKHFINIYPFDEKHEILAKYYSN